MLYIDFQYDVTQRYLLLNDRKVVNRKKKQDQPYERKIQIFSDKI